MKLVGAISLACSTCGTTEPYPSAQAAPALNRTAAARYLPCPWTRQPAGWRASC
jgi:hypothetical protein